MRKLRANAYEIGFPEGWSDHSTIVMLGPARPGFSPNVQVNQESMPEDAANLEAYFAEQLADLQNLEGFRVLERGDRTLGGQRALFHAYTWRIPQGIDIRQLQLATVRGNMIFTVTASATVADWDHFEGAFEMILAGFKFAG